MVVAVAVLRPDRLDGALDLLSCAGESLAAAHMARSVPERSSGTRLAVLRAAAAVLAVRGRTTGAAGPVDVWRLLPQVAPELTEWADFFATVLPEGGARPGHGASGPMSVREVDDLLRQGEDFVRLVAGILGLPPVRVTGDLVALTPSSETAHFPRDMRADADQDAHLPGDMRAGGSGETWAGGGAG